MSSLKFFIAVVCLGLGSYQLYLSQDSDFVPVPAKIVESFKRSNAYAPTHRARRTDYFFAYAYQFEGKNYISKRYSHGYKNTVRGVQNFQPGQIITVYANPDNPEYAVIAKGTPWTIFWLIYLSIIIGINAFLERKIIYCIKHKIETDKQLQKFHNLSGVVVGVSLLLGFLFLFILSVV